jgi:hypothetical protein
MSNVRRLAPVVGALIALAILVPAPALAKSKGGVRVFKATEAGSSVIVGGAPGTLNVTSDAFIRGRLIGTGALHLDNVARPLAGGGWRIVGGFRITAQNGDVLRGTSSGRMKTVEGVNQLEFRSRVTGGTGRFAGARGRLVSKATFTIASIDSSGTIRTSDRGTCYGRIRLAGRGGRR